MTLAAGLARRAGRVARALSGIRGRMITLLFAAGVPVLVIAVGNALQAQDAALREGLQRVASAREVATAQVSGALESLDLTMRMLGRTQPELGSDPADCAELLRRLLDMQPGRYGNLWVIEAGGTRRCAGLPGEVQIPPPESSQWHRPLAIGELALGAFLVGGGPSAPLALHPSAARSSASVTSRPSTAESRSR